MSKLLQTEAIRAAQDAFRDFKGQGNLVITFVLPLPPEMCSGIFRWPRLLRDTSTLIIIPFGIALLENTLVIRPCFDLPGKNFCSFFLWFVDGVYLLVLL